MIQTKFTVSLAKKSVAVKASMITLFVVLQAILFVLISPVSFLGLGLLIVSPAVFIVSAITSVLFMVGVNDSNISVRTRLGKRFSFDVSEISKLIFYKELNGYNVRSAVIIIKTASNKIIIKEGMIGFQLMIEYILEKLASGEINEAAASPYLKIRIREILEEKGSVTYTREESLK